jgi:uncharacterized phage protein gp47/JayE
MGDTPVCVISETGCARPTFDECLSFVQVAYRAIYGADTYLGNDCQDGQFVALLARALHDCNGQVLNVFNSFAPAGARGVALDRLVKINNLRRKNPSYSIVPVRVVGVAEIEIAAGLFEDVNGISWALPPNVTIPQAGEIVVLATAQVKGATRIPAGGLDTAQGRGSITNTTYGWQSVNNVAAATPGQPVETDAQLRIRQSKSTALPSQTLLDGLEGALLAISGVNRLKLYENDVGAPDPVYGFPGNCIAAVLDGGDPNEIARIIRLKKGPSVNTFGSTKVGVLSTSGAKKTVAFSYLSQIGIAYYLDVTNLGGFTQGVQTQIAQTIADFTNGLDIGETVAYDQAYAAAKLYDAVGSKTYRINAFTIGRIGSSLGANLSTADLPMKYFEAVACDPKKVSFRVRSS